MQRQFRIVAVKGHTPEEAFETIIVSKGTVICSLTHNTCFLDNVYLFLPKVLHCRQL